MSTALTANLEAAQQMADCNDYGAAMHCLNDASQVWEGRATDPHEDVTGYVACTASRMLKRISDGASEAPTLGAAFQALTALGWKPSRADAAIRYAHTVGSPS